jgi:putative CocE/NonD family hydrolase
VGQILIPTRDGTRLAADLYRPRTAEPVPAVVEYTPYRKDDLRGATRDFGHFYLAERGIASVQLDVRGTGASEGSVADEYQHPQEQEDGYDALAWLARQPWCSGRTGMWGTSYAGFNALQVAQIQPPSLGAIVPIYATDDRYTDDMHFRGGALNGWSVIGGYALGMVSRNALPPHPERAGPRWREMWDRRLRENVPWLIRWLEEQVDGPYWRSTLARRYAAVRVPTLIIGGWRDFYVNAALRWFAHLDVPKKLIMGPWPHTPPDAAVPGPRIDFMHEVARWFTEFLRGEPTGIRDEPPATVFIQTPRPAAAGAPADTAAGHWRFEDRLPPERAVERAWHLAKDGGLDEHPPAREDVAEYRAAPFAVERAPDFGARRPRAGQAARDMDQANDAAYMSAPLADALEILGQPDVRLFAAASANVAFFAVRLWDVAPDGSAALVTQGLLNGTRRASMADPEPLVPGEITEIRFGLDAVSWVCPRGHRIGLTVSGTDFPDVWPSPIPARIRIHAGPSHPSGIALPVVPAAPAEAHGPPGPACEPALRPPPPRTSRFKYALEQSPVSTTYDPAGGRMTAREQSAETVRCPDGITEVTSEHETEMAASLADPARVIATARDRKAVRRPDLHAVCTATAELRSDASAFHLDLALEVTCNGAEYWRGRWVRTIPRRLL